MKVCRYDEGNTAAFTCPYHGWTYATDGQLVGVPFFKEAYQEKLDKSQWGLIEVAQMENYKGSVWATWDPQAPSFLDYLGDMKFYLDQVLDCRDGREGGSEVLGGIQKWVMPSNWKFASENMAGDAYHNFSHRSVDMVGIGPSGKGRRDWNDYTETRKLHIAIPQGGPRGQRFPPDQRSALLSQFQDTPMIDEYFRHCYEERKRRQGKDARFLALVATVFPNMGFLARQPRTIAVWQPRGALKTEAWRWFLVDKDAPREVKDILRHYYMRYSGPGG